MAHVETSTATLHGLMAEFETPTALVEAATKVRLAGYRKIDAYTPIPIEELSEALDLRRTRLPMLVLLGGILGGLGGYGLEYWSQAIAYPMNIGGRPDLSWPSFIPVAYECTILAAALFGVVGMLVLNGFPAPYHPVFNVPRFVTASRNRFFLCIETRDPKFDPDATLRFMGDFADVRGVSEVAE